MRPTLAVLALCGWLLPVALAAQEPVPAAEATPAPTPTPTPVPEETSPGDPDAETVPTPTPAPTPEPEPEPGPGEISIKADVQEGDEGHYQARGFVDLQTGSFRIQCDALDLYATETESGGSDRKLVAEGNVVFMRGEERLAGSKLTMEMGSGRGLFENALGYVQPGVFIEGDTIERLDSSTYRITEGKFTSCSQPNPRWSFRASSATVKVDDRIVGKNVVFEVKEVPAFYIPYFYYPIRKDQRSTGILFPSFGYSSQRGFKLGTGFFWAMGRSFDQTFSVERYSRFGYGFGHEFRYARRGRSGGTFRTYAFRLDPSVQTQASGAWDYDFDWSAIQELPGGFTANVSARLFSNIQFQQQFQDNLNLASSRQQRAVFNIRRSFGSTRVELTADTSETIFSDSTYDEFDQLVTSESTRVNRHLPSLSVRRSPGKIGRTGIVFSYEASADRLARGDVEDLEGHTRIDIAPSLSRPFALTFLQVTPRLDLRYTRYGASVADDGTEERPVIQRRFLESGVQMQGPQFSRVFNNPGGLYSERFKHIIGPEVSWSYRTRVEDFQQIPRFDRIDFFLGTHEIRYGLVNRFLAKRPDRGDKLVTHEFLSWRLYQTYYVQIDDNQNSYDPNYSSSAFGPGGEPSHYSPISSRLRLSPSRQLSFDYNLEYDVNFRQLRNMTVSTRLNHQRLQLQANWSRAKRISEIPEERVWRRDTVRGTAAFDLLPGRLKIEGGADLDLRPAELLGDRSRLIQAMGRLRYDVQCCGFMLEAINYDYNQRSERQIRFSIELANIGSVGNFMGEEGQRAGSGRRW